MSLKGTQRDLPQGGEAEDHRPTYQGPRWAAEAVEAEEVEKVEAGEAAHSHYLDRHHLNLQKSS